jgi:iron complex transport system permease protein
LAALDPTPKAEPPQRAVKQRHLLLGLLVATGLLLLGGLAAGSEGLSLSHLVHDWGQADAQLVLWQIRAPRSVGAWLVGCLLGMAGALAQGVFRNPLADPFLLGSAAGSSLAVTLVLAAGALAGHVIPVATAAWVERFGLVAAAFVGAGAGVGLSLVLARGAQQTLRLLLAGVVVGVMLNAVTELLVVLSVEALRGRQMFMMGSTTLLAWPAVFLLAGGLAVLMPMAMGSARVLDALTLGEDTAASLGVSTARWRLLLVVLLSAATGLAVAQAGLIAFVGLVSPHVVRRLAPSGHRFSLPVSALVGGVLLLAADVLARSLIAPQELPVGVVTAVLGGAYLMALLGRRAV